MLEVAMGWARAAGALVTEEAFQARPPCVCIALPNPHALLCCNRVWFSHALPAPLGRTRVDTAITRWVGARKVPGLLEGILVEPVPEDVDQSAQCVLSLDRLQRCADLIRLHALEGRALTQAERDDCSFHVRCMQNLADSLVRQSLVISRRVYQIYALVEVVLFSGLLKHVADCRDALLQGLRAVCTPEFHNHFSSNCATKFSCHPNQGCTFIGSHSTWVGACFSRSSTANTWVSPPALLSTSRWTRPPREEMTGCRV